MFVPPLALEFALSRQSTHIRAVLLAAPSGYEVRGGTFRVRAITHPVNNVQGPKKDKKKAVNTRSNLLIPVFLVVVHDPAIQPSWFLSGVKVNSD